MGTVKRPLLASAGRGFFYWGGFFLTSFLSSLRRACLSLPYVRLCEDEARGRSNPDKNKHSCPSLRGGTTKQSRKKQHTKQKHIHIQSTLPSPHFLPPGSPRFARDDGNYRFRFLLSFRFAFILPFFPFVFAPCLSVFALCPSLRGRGTRTKQSRQKLWPEPVCNRLHLFGIL
jgi:hypothetical protein